MNKQDLSHQAKVPVQAIDSIFKTVGVPLDLPDYTDEHLNLVLAIRDVHKNEGAKSWVEAVGIFRKPEREHQLKEVALRQAISDEDIPGILATMKLKLETISDSQIDQFRETCRLIQSGMSLEMAAQTALNPAQAEVKAKAKTDANEKTNEGDLPAQSSAISPAQNSPSNEPAGAIAKSDRQISEVIEQPNEDHVPPSFTEHLNYLADAVVSTDHIDSIDLDEMVADRAIRVKKTLNGAIDQAIWGAIITKNTQGGLNANRTLEILKRKRMEHDAAG
jgi:hypothetical protein